MNRQLHRWNVQLQQADGQIKEVTFDTYWSAENDFVTAESIADAAACREHVKYHSGTNLPKQFAGVSAVSEGPVTA